MVRPKFSGEVETKHTHRYLNYVVKNTVPTNERFNYGVAFPNIGPEVVTLPSAFIGRVCSCKEVRWLKWGPRKEMQALAKKWVGELKAASDTESAHSEKTPPPHPPAERQPQNT